MRKCGCFIAPPAGLKTLKKEDAQVYMSIRSKRLSKIHCLKNGRYIIS